MTRIVTSRKDSLNVLIVGGGFNNKGAEAMVLTTVEQIRARWPAAAITVCSYTAPQNAARSQKGEGWGSFEYFHHRRQLSLPLKVLVLGLRVPAALKRWTAGADRYLAALAKATIVIDVSGFALSDQRPMLRRLVYCFEIAAARWVGARFAAMTQAFGPFSGATRLLARAFLPLADLVVARGNESADHLRAAGITSFAQCTDMAYLFKGDSSQEGRDTLSECGVPSGVPILGIVPNINLYQQSPGLGRDNRYAKGLGRLSLLAHELGAFPVFICHESHATREDDEWVARQAAASAELERFAIVAGSACAARLKGVIGVLDFVVASRFHSIVAAISTATPFMALGWSHKYQELVDEANEPCACVDGRSSDSDEWCQRTTQLWNARHAMRQRLLDVGPRLEATAEGAFHLLERVLSDHSTSTAKSSNRGVA